MSNWTACIVLTKDNPLDLESTLLSISKLNFSEKLSVHVIESWSDENAFKKVFNGSLMNFDRTDFEVTSYRIWPSSGIFYSMNEALKIIESSYPNITELLFMNSGDCFACKDSLSELSQYKQAIQEKMGTLFPAVFGRAKILASPSLSWFMPKEGLKTPTQWLKHFDPNHQAVLFDAAWSFKNHYDIENKYYADRKVMRDALRGNEEHAFADVLVSQFNLLGHTSRVPTWREFRQKANEPDRGFGSKFNEFMKFLIPRRFSKFYPYVMYCRSKLISTFC